MGDADKEGLKKLPHWDKGDRIKAVDLNALAQAISVVLNVQPPLFIKNINGNICLYVKAGTSSDEALTPFLIQIATTTKITVRYGQVNNITPTMNGTPLDNNNPPQLTVSSEGNNDIYLDLTIDSGGNITAMVVGTAATTPENTFVSGTGGHGYLTLGNVTITAGKITGSPNQSVTNSQNMQCCGDNPRFGAI